MSTAPTNPRHDSHSGQPPGWYPDQAGFIRWWDGRAWDGPQTVANPQDPTRPLDAAASIPGRSHYAQPLTPPPIGGHRKLLHWIGYPATALVALLIGAGVSGNGSTRTDSARATPASTVTVEASAPPVTVFTTDPQATTAAAGVGNAQTTGAAETIDEPGTYVIGEDIKPGTWKTSGGDTCYWARLKTTDGDLDSIIANDNITGPTTVTVKKTDKAFETDGACTWTRKN